MKQNFTFRFFTGVNIYIFFVFLFVLSTTLIQAHDWKQMDHDIVGMAPDDHGGVSVNISDDGLTIAIGAFGNNENGPRADEMLGVSDKIYFAPVFYPNPSNGSFTIGLDKVYSNVTIKITDLFRKHISTTKYNSAKTFTQRIERSS